MDYTIKLEANAVTDRLFICMTQKNHADDRGRAAELEFYLPAGVTPFDTSQLKRIWARLFSHRVEPLE